MKRIVSVLITAACATACSSVEGGNLSTTTTTVEKTTTVSIETKSTGTGDNKVTYYVAHVVLGNPSDIGSIVKTGYTSELAREAPVMFAINGDYFTYRNNGIIIRNGSVVVDEPIRQGMAITDNGSMVVYEENSMTVQQLKSLGATNSFSFGPILVSDSKIPEDVDSYYEVDAGRSINGRHPRTGICMVSLGNFIFIVVDGRSPGYSRGVTLAEFAEMFRSLGCVNAYNLDGGGSSVMFYEGFLVNNPLGKGRERTNGDMIFVSPS